MDACLELHVGNLARLFGWSCEGAHMRMLNGEHQIATIPARGRTSGLASGMWVARAYLSLVAIRLLARAK